MNAGLVRRITTGRRPSDFFVRDEKSGALPFARRVVASSL
jgi:hypothetical protein